MKKERLDLKLVALGLVSSRTRAQAMIMSGHVLVNDVPETKAGTLVAEDVQIRLRHEEDPYVSRAAYKLLSALDGFSIDPKDKMALDIGASTGGFTQVLLERGVQKVIALDVGTNQLHWKIRSDPRVVVLEKTNARNLTPDQLPYAPSLVVVDVSFIGLNVIFPAIVKVMSPSGMIITLIKPQFEVGRESVGKGGIVTDPIAVENAITRVTQSAEEFGLKRLGLIQSPIKGTDGNQEYLAAWTRVTTQSN